MALNGEPGSNIAELFNFHRYLFPSWDSALERQLLDRFGLAGSSQEIKQLSKGQATPYMAGV